VLVVGVELGRCPRETKETTSVLTSVFGLPTHILINHAAVVFIPLASLFAIVYAVVPPLRRHIWWVVLALAVLAPVTGWLARLSGQRYLQYFLNHGASGSFLDALNKHQSYGLPTAWWATGLGAAMLIMALVTMPSVQRLPLGAAEGILHSAVARWVTIVASVVLAVVALYYVIQTGDSGARAVHPPI
jgi:hypothetical protein